ncbi:hypothetical protein ACA910_010228 [Epithemia clementina (nom. ined.)]
MTTKQTEDHYPIKPSRSTASVSSGTLKKPANDDDDNTSCCGSFYSEIWPFQPWFAVEEPSTQRMLDVSATFGPVTSLAFLAKFVTCGYVVATQYMAWTASRYPLFFYAYYTSWSLLFATIYSAFSFMNCMYEVAQPEDGIVRGRAQYTWVVFNLAVFSQFLATVAAFVNWIVVLDAEERPDYLTLATHGFVFLVICVDGFLIGRIPLRWMHIWLSWALMGLFLIWSILHESLGIGNPNDNDKNPETNDDAIYSSLAWNDENGIRKSFIASVLLFLASPILFGILRAISVGQLTPYCWFDYLSDDRRRYLEPDVELGYRRVKS